MTPDGDDRLSNHQAHVQPAKAAIAASTSSTRGRWASLEYSSSPRLHCSSLAQSRSRLRFLQRGSYSRRWPSPSHHSSGVRPAVHARRSRTYLRQFGSLMGRSVTPFHDSFSPIRLRSASSVAGHAKNASFSQTSARPNTPLHLTAAGFCQVGAPLISRSW
jgi:hypothetical protein